VADVIAGQTLGRDAELSLLRGFATRVAAGQGGTVWVEGEPGIGKSSLIDTAVSAPRVRNTRDPDDRRAADPIIRLVRLRGRSAVRQDPSDRVRTEIADLLAGAGRRVDAVLAASERLVALIEFECARSPVILVGEDLQWADEASLGVWHRLTSVAGQAPLLLVSSCRPVPHREAVDRLRSLVERSPGAAVVELGPLGAATAVEMASALLSAPPGATLRQELSRAGGNPLYLRELLEALMREGVIRIEDGVAELAGPVRAELRSLSAAIARRLGFLSTRARSVLRAGALLGVRFPLRDLAIVAGCPVAELTPIVSEGFRAGVLAEDGVDLRFRHPLIGQALHDEVPAAVRVALHSLAAHELASGGASWDLVARHLLAEPTAIDEWALDWLVTVPAAAL
jgi:predicted ATPase